MTTHLVTGVTWLRCWKPSHRRLRGHGNWSVRDRLGSAAPCVRWALPLTANCPISSNCSVNHLTFPKVVILSECKTKWKYRIRKSIWIRGVVHSKNPRTPPNKIRKKSKDFFEDEKSVNIIWEWTTPRIQCLHPFSFIESSKKKFEKSEKFAKKSKNPKKF